MTSHFSDESLHKYWIKLLGQQNFLLLNDPHKICECIVGAVAICEQNASMEDLEEDGLGNGVSTALACLAKNTGEISKYSADGLPAVPGSAEGIERL
jgi:hypothetical protein